MDSPRPLRKPLIERFWDKVKKTDTCWLWTGSTVAGSWGGYGTIRLPHRGKVIKAHRLSWELHNGPVPKGKLICHTCDNPPCVRPDHLFLGTNGTNMIDCDRKGRRRYALARLTKEQVIELRSLHSQGVTRDALAKRFNIASRTVYGIIARERWKYI